MMDGTQQKRETKVENGDARGNENGSGPTWDVDAEHYHMLSYFMGGDPSAGFAHNHGDRFVTTADGATTHATIPSGSEALNGSLQNNTGSNSSSSGSLHMDPPPTPAVQFYSHRLPPSGANTSPGLSSTGRAPPLTASSSSSSLSSMAATLVSGGPVVHSMFNGSTATASGNRKDSPLSPSMMRISPISPAAIIGQGQENLMLPPPRRAAKGNGSASEPVSSFPQQQQPIHPAHDPEQKQRHMAWLQHINSIAMKTAQQGETPQPSQAMHPPPPLTSAAPAYQTAPSIQGVPIAMTAPVLIPAPPPTAGESEEKRARRLKRNRESARQSRRRKKEHLAKLEEQVNRLHVEIETNRRKQIVKMEAELALKWSRQVDSIDDRGLALLLERSSPNNNVRRAIISFQYAALKQLLLPKYQEFLLWLTLHPDSYFVAGKEEHAKLRAADKTTKISSNRVSSKQIGEELSSEYNPKGKKKVTKKEAAAAAVAEQKEGFPTSTAMDAARMWPLFCYEMSISVDQEERLLQAQKKVRQLPNLPNDRSQMAVATRMSSNMTHGVLYQAHTTEHRRQSSLLHTLTPEQTVKYLRWFASNQDRCQALLKKKGALQCGGIKQDVAIEMEHQAQENANRELSLNEVCLKLERVLRIPTTKEIKKEEDGSYF